MLKADFHIHTRYSHCSNMEPAVLVKTALAKGYDVIGVVDHNNIIGGMKTKKIAGRKLLVIPGEEIKTLQGEIVVMLSDGKYRGGILDVCDRAKEEGHFVYVPHPFDIMRFSLGNNIEKVKSLVNAIEVFNSRVMLSKLNQRAKRFAEENKIPRIAGSDAHFLEEIGNVTCLLDCEKNTDSVLEYVRKNKLKFSGKKTSPLYNFKSMI